MQGNAVTHLDLSGRSLGGDLDAAVADIDTLVELDVSNNFITGQIPPELANLTHLQAGLVVFSPPVPSHPIRPPPLTCFSHTYA